MLVNKYYFYEKTTDLRYRVVERDRVIGFSTVCFCDSEYRACEVSRALNQSECFRLGINSF